MKLAYSLWELRPAEHPPVASVVGAVQPDVRPGSRAQAGAVGAQGQGLGPLRALVVEEGLSTCLCAPQVHTAYTQHRETQPLTMLITAASYPHTENEA